MSSEGLNISNEGDVAIVTFDTAAVLDVSTRDSVACELLALAGGPTPPKVLVDFSAVRFVASRLLGLLVELTKKAQCRGGRVVLCGLHEELSQVLRVTRLQRILATVPDRRRAMEFLGAAAP